MADDPPGLAELCEAIGRDDAAVVAQRRKAFVARNWGFITTIDQLAHADARAENHDAAMRKLQLIEELFPEGTGFFLRRAAAAMRAGVSGATDELANCADRLATDDQLFHVVEELVGNGRPDLAAKVIDACAARTEFSPGLVAAARSLVLATAGRLGDAIAALDAAMQADAPNLTAMRCRYLLLENILAFPAANELCIRAALVWGEERELRHVVERLAYVLDFEGAATALRMVCERHPGRQALAEQLTRDMAAARAEAEAAVAMHGEPRTADPAEIFKALSEPGVAGSRVLWARQALMALLRDDRLTEAEYSQFAWFLPNWEEGPVRNHILSAGRRLLPDAPAVRRGWLHYLITQGFHGDAALHCRTLNWETIDEDSLFFVILLLRLQQDRMAPVFMPPDLFEALRGDVLARLSATSPGFRCVMQPHAAALGGNPASWPDDALPPHDAPDAAGFRRLFAVTSGRLSLVSTGTRETGGGPLRPVLAISGQLRGFETAWRSIHAHLCAPTQAPVIVTVWDKSANATGRHARRLERALPDDIVAQLRPEERYTDAFEQAYPQTYRLLFGQTAVDAAELHALVAGAGCRILAVETEAEDAIGRLVHPHVSANMLKMYYKFARLEALICEAETRSGEMFSHVIWSRPDCDILRLDSADLVACLQRTDLAWSSFVTETSFGDYAMVLPRRAFAAIAKIFLRVTTAGHTRLMPWRPNRSVDPTQPRHLDAFGGPDVLFDVLLAEGYVPLARIPRFAVRLLGRTPKLDIISHSFWQERQQKSDRRS